MIVLGIESSCDDMAAAVVEDGVLVLSSVVSSQDDVHAPYGGVVPELASRRHIETVIPVVEEALKRASLVVDEVDALAVTRGPGLVGSILIGLNFAKCVAYVKKKPYVGVNHLEAHSLAAFLRDGEGSGNVTPSFPFVSLVVSGGHTSLFLYKDFTSYEVLGQTRDDAAGEAFDKVAKLLGLGYPGGAAIDRVAANGDRKGIAFTRSYIKKGSLEFSFSGVKTAVLTHLKNLDRPVDEKTVADIAASFQETVVDVLVKKSFWALEATGATDLVIAGGVACNSRLRARLRKEAEREGVRLFTPPPKYCSDNGAMIAALGYHRLSSGERAGLDLNAEPSWR